MPQCITRAFYRAIAIPGATAPYDRASLKVYYPAVRSDSPEERNTGVVDPAPSDHPFPIVILLPGINLDPAAYSWLAQLLAAAQVVTVTFNLIAEEMPGYISLTPGLDVSALAPDDFGQRPSATAVGVIIEDLERLNREGLLADRLDLKRIVLGGHSAGGTTALLNANPDWFAGLAGAFSYGAHTGASTALGHPPETLLQTDDRLPLLVMGGTRDGCIANSAARYGDAQQQSPTARVEQTYEDAMSGGRGDRWLALIDGANHFSLAFPADHSTGRGFIDLPTTRPDHEIRDCIAQLIAAFVEDPIRGGNGDQLAAVMARQTAISDWRRK